MEPITIIVDFEPEISYIEAVFNKYIPDDKHLLFTIGRRYPLDTVDKVKIPSDLIKYIRHIPYHPYKCVKFIEYCILSEMYNNSPYYKLFEGSRLIPTKGKCFTEYCPYSPEDILTWAIEPSELLIEDKDRIVTLVNSITNKVLKLLSNYNSNIISFNDENDYIAIQVGEEIGLYRYKEAIEYFSANGICKEAIEYFDPDDEIKEKWEYGNYGAHKY